VHGMGRGVRRDGVGKGRRSGYAGMGWTNDYRASISRPMQQHARAPSCTHFQLHGGISKQSASGANLLASSRHLRLQLLISLTHGFCPDADEVADGYPNGLGRLQNGSRWDIVSGVVKMACVLHVCVNVSLCVRACV